MDIIRSINILIYVTVSALPTGVFALEDGGKFSEGCTNNTTSHALKIAKAIAETDYLNSYAPASIKTTTTISSTSDKNGKGYTEGSFQAQVDQSMNVKSTIVKQWKDGQKTCVKIEITNPESSNF